MLTQFSSHPADRQISHQTALQSMFAHFILVINFGLVLYLHAETLLLLLFSRDNYFNKDNMMLPKIIIMLTRL